MDKNYLVTKANTLITSNYDLSVEEQRIILTLASTVQPNDADFKPYQFNIKDFMELLGVESKTKYSVIPKITKDLMQKVLEIKQGNDILQVAWLSSAHYRKGTGTVELEFSPKLKPFMLGLKEFYTSYRLKNVLELKGKYSIRIYEILKSNQFKKVAQINVDELRKILKVDSGSYLIYQNFKNRVIVQAQKELKAKTDIFFDFEEIKTGRKVTAIRFYIKSNAKNEIAATSSVPVGSHEVNPEVPQRKLMFIQEELTLLEEKKIIDTAGGDIDLIREKYEIAKAQGHINNLVAWLVEAIKGDYKNPKKVKWQKPNSSSNERHYNAAELERQLLARSSK